MMRFAALLVYLVLNLAGLSARAEGVARDGPGLLLGAGLRAASDSDGAQGFARLSLDAPLTAGLAVRGLLDLGAGTDGGQGDLQVGAGLRLDRDHWAAFADLTYDGAGQGASAETGVDLVARAGSHLTLEAGPRFLVGPDHPAREGQPPGAADPKGLFTAGLRLSARYDLGENWGLDGSLRLDQPVFRDDPSRQEGEAARVSATIMATHRFQLEF